MMERCLGFLKAMMKGWWTVQKMEAKTETSYTAFVDGTSTSVWKQGVRATGFPFFVTSRSALLNDDHSRGGRLDMMAPAEDRREAEEDDPWDDRRERPRAWSSSGRASKASSQVEC